jgi:hypothetical protein
MKDVWQIDMVGRTSAERTGYATQKPETLLLRIIESCSREGDLCADFFGGSATLAAAAQKMGRKWISCDASGIAIAQSYSRLVKRNSAFTVLRSGDALDPCTLNVQIVASTGDDLTSVRLESYHLDKIPDLGADSEMVQTLLKQDSLQLLEYWSVDFHYDGKLHRPDRCFVRNDGIVTTCEGRAAGLISVCAVDVFGNRCFQVVDMGDEEDEELENLR